MRARAYIFLCTHVGRRDTWLIPVVTATVAKSYTRYQQILLDIVNGKYQLNIFNWSVKIKKKLKSWLLKKKTTTNYTRRSKPSEQCQCCTVARLDFVRIYTLLLDRPTVIMAAVAATTTTAVQSHNLKLKWSLVSNVHCAAELFPLRFYWLVSKKEYVRPLLRRFETMSLPFSGSKSKSAGLVSAIRKQLFLLNLKPVKRVFVKYDPFTQNAVTTRLLYLTVLVY